MWTYKWEAVIRRQSSPMVVVLKQIGGGDRILQYHPRSRHHGDIPYFNYRQVKQYATL